MNRRFVLKSLATSFGALATLPAWATGWTKESTTLLNPFLSLKEDNLLMEIVGTIIPEGDKPGAKSVGVPEFIQKLVVDCYEKKAQTDFKQGLDGIEKLAQSTFNQSFTNLEPSKKEEILRGVSNSTDPQQKEFFSSLRSLVIQGYTSSEYVMTAFYKYDMMPGHYYGCVPV